MAPFVIVTLLYAVSAVKQTYALQSLPAWVSGLSGVEGIGGALAYYERRVTMSVVDVLRVIPYVNIVSTENAGRLLTLDRLLPLTMLIPALCYGIGYLSGPRRRAMIHGSIVTNRRRQAKKERAARRRRAKGPRELV